MKKVKTKKFTVPVTHHDNPCTASINTPV